jgi:hypothetical protein
MRPIVSLLHAAVAAAFLGAASASAQPAESRFGPAARSVIEAREPVALVMTGIIGRGSYRQFRRAVARSEPDVIVLSGPGGILGEALRIADEVRRRGIATMVGPDSICASACAIVFLSGQTKFMGAGARVGLHAASFANGRADPEATDIMASYLRGVGVPRNVLRRMAATSPSDIRWLTRAERRRLKIRPIE